jgi:pilus assembly protein Flp/PilA
LGRRVCRLEPAARGPHPIDICPLGDRELGFQWREILPRRPLWWAAHMPLTQLRWPRELPIARFHRGLGPVYCDPHIISLVIVSQALGVAYQHPQTDAGIAAIERARDIMRQLLRFLRSEDGPTAVEYAVMLALIVIVCMAGIQSLTEETAASYNRSAAAIDGAIK